MAKKLLIILNDNLSDLVKKGEVVKRYYNPKNFFDEIHYLLINQKKINDKKLQIMSGDAKIHLHTIDLNFIEKIAIIFNFLLLFIKLDKFYKIVKKINPNVTRCYNINYSIFLAYIIKIRYNVPYIISLHCNHKDLISRLPLWKKIIVKSIIYKIKEIFFYSYKLLPVYSTATYIIKDMKLNNYKICYNFIGEGEKIREYKNKKKIINLICTNRQFKDKNPINIIKAIKEIENVKLTLIGNGTYHHLLKNYVITNKLKNKVLFIKNIINSEYLKILNKSDILILHSNILEFSKSSIEAMSFKKPIIINKQRRRIIELDKNFCLTNANNENDYKKSILKLIENRNFSKTLGINGYKIYKRKYDSKKMEENQRLIYKKLLKI